MAAFWAIRLISTLSLLPVLTYVKPRWRPAAVAAALLAMDMIDAPVFYATRGGVQKLECVAEYQRADKLVDQVQYAAALVLLYVMCRFSDRVIVATHLLRWIGVFLFVRDGSVGSRAKRWLAFCPDVTKELLLLASFPSWNVAWAVVAVIAGKTLFEYARLRVSRQCDARVATEPPRELEREREVLVPALSAPLEGTQYASKPCPAIIAPAPTHCSLRYPEGLDRMAYHIPANQGCDACAPARA